MKKLPYKIRLTIAGIVLILSALAVWGLVRYPLDTQFAALFQRTVFDFSLSAVIILTGIILLTVFFGRFYCSVLCPFGILQEFAALIFRKKNRPIGNYKFKYYIAALTFGALIGGTALLIRYIDPYTIFGSAVSLSLFGLLAAFAVIFLVFFKNRFFCTNICPVGAILGLLSKISPNKIYINKNDCVSCGLCEKACPAGCINSKEKLVDNETGLKCLKCLGECRKAAIKYGIKPKEELKFNFKRREFLKLASVFVLFGIAVKAGAEIAANTAKKFRDIILPPGAKDENRMFNKCLNCNLCVENCPNKIIAKADKDFGTVHLNYNMGKGFCDYNCNKCSEVCPSGAIKKIPLEEKKKTRIGMAMITDRCKKCGKCISECPAGAISKNKDGQTVIDGSKCIGCGKCKNSCPNNAIEIFAVREQVVV